MSFMLPADEDAPAPVEARRRNDRAVGAADKIDLRRPRDWRFRSVTARRVVKVVAVVVAVVVLIVVGVFVALRLMAPPQLPEVTASDAAGPFLDGIEEFESANGSYPASFDELVASQLFTPLDDMSYRIVSNVDGSEYVAGASGFTGGYVAATSADPGVLGEGATMQDALDDVGWTSEWAAEAGFTPTPVVEHYSGSIDVYGETVTRVVTSLDTGEYIVTVTGIPKVGVGGSWQEAVEAAGGDPGLFTVPDDAGTGEPAVFEGDDGGVLTMLDDGTDVTVRLVSAPTQKATSMVLETALEEAGVEGMDASGAFTCATSTDGDGIHSVTACHTVSGEWIVWATTGLEAATADVLEAAMGMAGAGEVWADEHGIVRPTSRDLF